MPSQPYPMGTFPKQYVGGGVVNHTMTPNPSVPTHVYTGGVVFAGGSLQNTRLFDSNLGVLAYPYLGIRNQYNENKPVQGTETGAGFGVTKAISNGTFAVMQRGQYVMLTFNSQLAGISTTLLQSPANSNKNSENKNIGWVDTVLINSTGGFYMDNGLPVNPLNSRDYIKVEPASTYSTPGRLTFQIGSNVATVKGYHSKTD